MELVRYNLHPEVVEGLQAQIGEELGAEAAYRAMAIWAGRWDVGLPGFRAFFAAAALEERGHAEAVMDYLLSRGAVPRLPPVPSPGQTSWAGPEAAILTALALEHRVNAALLRLSALGEARGDPHLLDWLARTFLDEQVKAIRELATLVTRIRNAGPHALIHIDAELAAQSS